MKNLFHHPLFMAVAMLAMLAAPGALAVTFNLNSFLDQPDDLTIPGTCHTAAGTCTLRAAVMQANRTSGAGATINLPAGTYLLTIPAAGSNGETNGDLNLTAPAAGNPVITITGVGAATTIIDGNQLDGVFSVDTGRTVFISGVTIRNGYRISVGGGIYNAGSLTVNNAAISGNHSGSYGGGIYNIGFLTVTNTEIGPMNVSDRYGGGIFSTGSNLDVTNSTLSQNKATGGGGGLVGLTTTTLTDSTIAGNTATFGGGIYAAGTMTVTNGTVKQNTASSDGGGIFNLGDTLVSKSTLSQNYTGVNGGGIYNDSNLVVINSTIALNNADNDGGGIYNTAATGTANVYSTSIVFNGADFDQNGGNGGGVFNNTAVGSIFNLRNSLVAGNNLSNAPVYDECSGVLTSYGRNLFGAGHACTINIGLGGGYANLNSFAFLGPLQNNGGPTFTVALLPGSNAIDFGDPVFGCTDFNGVTIPTDQRGLPRAVGFACDVGAYEYSPATKPILQGAKSRKAHGVAGTFDLPL